MAKPTPTIGTLLRQLREEAGLSVRRLAELSGVDQANISRLETGQATKPMLSSLTKLAEALGADPARFYKAAGSSTDTTLPSLRPYLRAKYGHLPAARLDEVAAFFEQVEAEQIAKRRSKTRR
jgi:transcriptional regulator with XRE-family HTH domain